VPQTCPERKPKDVSSESAQENGLDSVQTTQRDKAARSAVEERRFSAASLAGENGTKSRRDALEKADDVLPHSIFLRHPSPFHGDSVVASTHRPFIVNTDRHFVNQIQSMADRD